MQLPKESIDAIVSVADQNEEIIKRIESLEKINSKKSWQERNWFWITITTLVISSLLAPMLVETWKVKVLEPAKERKQKLEAPVSPNKDKTPVLPTAKPK